jgi:IMP dehydrogenase
VINNQGPASKGGFFMTDYPEFPLALSYDDVLLVPGESDIKSRSDVDISTQITPRHSLKIPIVSANMDTVTNSDMAIIIGKLGGLGILPRFNTVDQESLGVSRVKKAGLITCAAIGVKNGFIERADALVTAGADIILIDVAHGHMHSVAVALKTIRDKYPHLDLIAGNVGTFEAAEFLFKSGADCVKVGIGPGNACTTRTQTGFGVPQITATLEAAKAAKKYHKFLMCDGGTKNSGDIVKGLAAGAHTVMIGSQFAATKEAPGETVEKDGRIFKQYNGSTSAAERTKQGLSAENVEGASVLLPCVLSVESLVNQFVSGIRSGFSYAGAKNIQEFHQKAKFIRISPQAWTESASRHLN